ncbi:DUF3054 domain-containing protein [Natronolimnohabitans innermongolicus]|uniref:DUF3054 domain-containing protein n=1 Tax=Natronolimnohabitans innermongolicus JCM 12255 TaxID=1227499 RepID=L9X7M2_9EURY|nr:DUF3054 domain-containing protein [Natronolimnohabitans innermongolicus]ELY57769.1 hypothetical protein C493_07764 [Natronolimnohabitans innermongolicus JCM 12255]
MDAAVRTDDWVPTLDRETLLLGAVDVVLLAALVVVGQLDHGMDPFGEPLAALEAAAPFVIGWLVVAALAGLYARPNASSVPQAARLATLTWLAAANVGLILRQGVFDDTATWPFPLVITGFGLLLLVGWRVGYAAYASRVRSSGGRR